MTQTTLSKLIKFFIPAFVILNFHSTFADDSIHLRFGVLSFHPEKIAKSQWLPLANEIEHALPGYTVELLPMAYSDNAAKGQRLDFIKYLTLRKAEADAFAVEKIS